MSSFVKVKDQWMAELQKVEFQQAVEGTPKPVTEAGEGKKDSNP
jgi:hypothetical protein